MAKKSSPAKPTKSARSTKSTKAKTKPAKSKAKASKPKAKPAKPKAKAPARAVVKKAVKRPVKVRAAAAVAPSNPARNDDFPRTFISAIDVSLDDPDHFVRLTWTGPKAAAQEAGPFRSSPGAGTVGTNCDIVATSRRSGSNCTPKGDFVIEGFAARLSTDARAVIVSWFMRARGIAFHFFPIVPRFAASHGCVRLETHHVAQLIHDNSRVGVTKVHVGGTWTKPARQH